MQKKAHHFRLLKWILFPAVGAVVGILLIDNLADHLRMMPTMGPGERRLVDSYEVEFKVIAGILVGLLFLGGVYIIDAIRKIARYFKKS